MLFVFTPHIFAKEEASLSLDPIPNQMNAVRFDPSYYYDSPLKIEQLAKQLAENWHSFGVNTIFYKTYDPIYGAKYKTSYNYNIEADYGKKNLLKHILKACNKKNIRVFAWLPAFQHKAAWEKNPDWRIKSADGTDYKPTEYSYFLCPANPDVRLWWLGFLKDILEHYDDICGIDIAEPIIQWRENRCYCDFCTNTNKNNIDVSSNGLTETLVSSIQLIKQFDKKACVTTVASVAENGRVLSIKEKQHLTGFNLDGILNNSTRPDYVNFEFMWQQWKDFYKTETIFTPEWTEQAVRTICQQVDGKSTIIGHLEKTSFGQTIVDAEKLARSIRVTKNAGIEHIDIYDTHLLDKDNAWGQIKDAFKYVPTKNILVCYDPRGENDAKQIASLLSHFKAEIDLFQLNGEEKISDKVFSKFNSIFYVGIDKNYQIPFNFLKQLSDYQGTICWIHYGIDQFLNLFDKIHFGFQFERIHYDSLFNTVTYGAFSFPRLDPAFNEMVINDSSRCQQLATMTNGNDTLPYVIRSGNFWYFADLPTAFVVEGGRHIVISDLLHEIVGEDHESRRLALVRIEDINPMTDPMSLRKIADYLKSQNVPFSVALVPFYLNPESNTTVSLSDRPEFIDAIHYMIKKGGTIVMHGSTHQYRGETTADYEFWDMMSGSPLFSDSKEYVKQRLIAGLAELGKNQIYPLAWETPHYGASQLDYSVINTFFSTSYERRQTVNLHGSDQLVPYLIQSHTAGGKVIPENLGYIPLAAPVAGPLLKAAQNNLAIRDGVVSFFFHPFVELSVLKDIVKGIKKFGYTFTSPRYTSNWVKTPDFTVLTGKQEIQFSVENKYFHEFFISEKGKIKNETYSDSLITDKISKQVIVPKGWIYVAEQLSEKPKNYFVRKLDNILPSIANLSTMIWGEEKNLDDPNAMPLRAAVVCDSTAKGLLFTDQLNFMKALKCVGVDVLVIDISKFLEVPSEINLLIVPYATAQKLTEQQNLFILHAIQSGLNLILEKNSSLSENIGIRPLEKIVEVEHVFDEYFPQVGISWKQPDSLREFDIDIEYVSYYSEKDTELPIVVGGEYGEGKYLYFATFFDPYTEGGYGRFPYFIDLLNRQFNLVPTIRRNEVEVYFEPGDREDISIEDLIKIWRKNGVRRIYVSAWHFYETYHYDYERLIRLAHQNAMLVYAWLELPHVSEKFWDDNPNWREKTATGKEAKIDWRRLMALNIIECKQAVFALLRDILTSYNWDGVNLAELNHESQHGYLRPDTFTPMNEEFRKSFSLQKGFDPILLFNPRSKYFWKNNSNAADIFNKFREDNIIQLHSEFLKLLDQIRTESQSEWQIIVTTVDNILSTGTGLGTAVNTLRIAELAKQFPFTLQIEDPQSLWHLGADRYTKMLTAYSEIRKRMPLILDINVVPYRDMNKSDAPTLQPTGSELYNLAKAASSNQTRLAIYSEASIYEVDAPLIPFALANEVTEKSTNNSWIVESPFTVNLMINSKTHNQVLVNGDVWPAYYRGRVLIPAGKHNIKTFSNFKGLIKRFKSNTRLVDLSGELISANAIARGIKFEYKSLEPNLIILSDEPKEILINNNKFECEILKGDRGYSLRLPAGNHSVTIYTQSSSTYLIRHVSVILSGLIVSIGSLAGGLLLIIYIRNSIRRKRSKT